MTYRKTITLVVCAFALLGIAAAQTPVPPTCGTTLSTPGAYQLTGDMTCSSPWALLLYNNTGISLDCAGHTITCTAAGTSACLWVQSAQQYQVKNCNVQVSTTLGHGGPYSFFAYQSPDGINGPNNHYSGTQMLLQYSGGTTGNYGWALYNSSSDFPITMDNGDRYVVYGSTIKSDASSDDVGVVVFESKTDGPIVYNSVIDGGWGGLLDHSGADDGIVCSQGCTNVLFGADPAVGLEIKNVYDAAIENVGGPMSGRIFGMYAHNFGHVGIGGWYYSSVDGLEVDHNIMTVMPSRPGEYGIDFQYSTGPFFAYPGPYKMNINIHDNLIQQSVAPPDGPPPFPWSYLVRLDLAGAPSQVPGTITIKDNYFGTYTNGFTLLPGTGGTITQSNNQCVKDTNSPAMTSCHP